MPVFFINSTQVEDEKVNIVDPLLSHLSKSLRTKPGDHLILNDERGRRYRTIISHVTKRALQTKIVSIQEAPPSSTPSVILAPALLKGEKMGWVIQKATELGVHTLAPLITERVIPNVSPTHAAKYQERWSRIALEAAQQSERWKVPEILPLQRFQDFFQRVPEGIRIMLVERQETVSISTIPLPSVVHAGIWVLIGPEGGWTTEEIRTAKSINITFATLGQGILRAETASLASLAILQARLHYL